MGARIFLKKTTENVKNQPRKSKTKGRTGCFLGVQSFAGRGALDIPGPAVLQTPRLVTGVFRALRAPSVPGVSRGCPRKRGCPRECSKGCPQGPLGPASLDCPKSVPRVSKSQVSTALPGHFGPERSERLLYPKNLFGLFFNLQKRLLF